VLRAVVQRGTLTAAATTLGYTVSAVSQQLSQLEREAGSPLLEKAGRGVRPTAAGLLLAEHATRILAAVDDAEGALADLRAGRTGALHGVHLLADQYRLLLRADHPLAGRRVVDLGALATTDWIATTGPATYVREATVTACRRAGFTPRFVAEGDEFAVTQGY